MASDITIKGSFQKTDPGPDSFWYCNYDGTPYGSTVLACLAVPTAVRLFRTVLVVVGGVNTEMWWESDTSNAGLHAKQAAVTSDPLKEDKANKAVDLSTNDDTHYPTTKAVAEAIAAALANGVRLASDYDASSNLFPTTGTGPSGGVRRGDLYIITVAGTLGGQSVDVGDTLIAKQPTPGQVAANWIVLEHNVLQASTTVRGSVFLAMLSDILAGTDNLKAITSAGLAYRFTQALTISGALTASGGLAMAGNKITGLANGTAATDAMAYGQRLQIGTTAGTAPDALTVLLKAQNLGDLQSALQANRNLGTAYNEDVAISGSTTIAVSQRGKMLQITTASTAATATLPSAATAGNGWFVLVRKADTGTGLLTVSGLPSAMALLTAGHTLLLWTDGTTWFGRAFFGAFDGAGGITITGTLTLATSLKIGGAGAVATLTRDTLAIRGNASVVAAVSNTGNAFNQYGDLTNFNDSTRLANGAPPAVSGQDSSILVGTADVVTGDYFVYTVGATTWLFIYDRRVYNGSSGWRRVYLAGDFEIFDTAAGIILRSQDGATTRRARITLNTAGNSLIVTPL